MKTELRAAMLAALGLLAMQPAWAIDAVRITNTNANPVPVTGSVSVSASAPLPVTGAVSVSAAAPLPVTGAVSVSAAAPLPVTGAVTVTATSPLPVTGTFTATLPSAVTVSNTAATPLFTTSAGEASRAPVHIQLSPLFANLTGNVAEVFTTPYVVPAGKRLVVEQVSGSVTWSVASVPGTAKIYFDTTAAQQYFLVPPVVLSSPAFPVVDGNNTQWVAAHGTAYFDGGTTVWLAAAASSTLFAGSFGFPNATLAMTGYMLDCAQTVCAPLVTQ